MSAAKITRAQAKAMGIPLPHAKQRTTRKEATGVPYHTRCVTCGREFHFKEGPNGEDTHVDETGHARYELVLT